MLHIGIYWFIQVSLHRKISLIHSIVWCRHITNEENLTHPYVAIYMIIGVMGILIVLFPAETMKKAYKVFFLSKWKWSSVAPSVTFNQKFCLFANWGEEFIPFCWGMMRDRYRSLWLHCAQVRWWCLSWSPRASRNMFGCFCLSFLALPLMILHNLFNNSPFFNSNSSGYQNNEQNDACSRGNKDILHVVCSKRKTYCVFCHVNVEQKEFMFYS